MFKGDKIQETDRFYMVAFVSIWLFLIEKIDVDSDVNEAEENVEGYCHTTSLHAMLSSWNLYHLYRASYIYRSSASNSEQFLINIEDSL